MRRYTWSHVDDIYTWKITRAEMGTYGKVNENFNSTCTISFFHSPRCSRRRVDFSVHLFSDTSRLRVLRFHLINGDLNFAMRSPKYLCISTKILSKIFESFDKEHIEYINIRLFIRCNHAIMGNVIILTKTVRYRLVVNTRDSRYCVTPRIRRN